MIRLEGTPRLSGVGARRTQLCVRGVNSLPTKISVAPGTETTDREVPVDAHVPHVAGDSASERLDSWLQAPAANGRSRRTLCLTDRARSPRMVGFGRGASCTSRLNWGVV
jgi:hypothetical protein